MVVLSEEASQKSVRNSSGSAPGLGHSEADRNSKKKWGGKCLQFIMCNRTLSLDALHSQILHEPRKLAVIGSGCSVATEAGAEVSHYYNITQISCASGSPELSDRIRFQRYFQLQSNAEFIVNGFYQLIIAHGWRRVALIVQDENLFTVIVARLKDLLDEAEEGVEYSEVVFDTITDLGSNPFDDDSRIFGLFMYSSHAVQLLCEAYHKVTRVSYRYVLLTMGWYSRFWWRAEQPGLSCTAEQRESVLSSTLAVTDEVFIDDSQANLTITPGITGEEFLAQEQTFIGLPPLNITFFPTYSQYCHDATWTLAYALNKTLNSLEDRTINEEIAHAYNVTPPFRLQDFTYSSDKLLEVVFNHLRNTSFYGFTGKVSFDDEGIRKLYNLTAFQYRHVVNVTDEELTTFLDIVRIGYVYPGITLAFVAGENITTLWNGSIPYDGVAIKELVTVHPAISSITIILACAGIVFAVASLIFNFIYRHAKLIKLASTKLNYLIGIGAIILYLNTFFFVIPITDANVVRVFCNLTPWLTAVGYSLCYGTILAKMARVYYIFNNPSPKKKKVKDRFLILGVASLVAIDLIILVVFTLVEDTRVVSQVPNRERPTTTEGNLGIITDYCINICDSTARDVFLGILYGYKMILQIIALLLAFSIRKVKVKGLNDSKYIGAAIYVTSIVLAMIIVATYSLKEFINGFAALFCTGIILGTTVILMLVFVPLMVGLYSDPNGEDIFKRSTVDSNSAGVSKFTYSESDMLGLRKRIKELEDEVKETHALMAATKNKSDKSSRTKSETILQSLEGSHMVNKDHIKKETTIWDTPGDQHGEQKSDNGNATAL